MIHMSLPSVKQTTSQFHVLLQVSDKEATCNFTVKTFLIKTRLRFQPHFRIYMKPTEIPGLPVSTPLL